ncbi:MAG: hypothetical protein LLF28_03650 [Nitrospiraceae bacterium]|nr:hypothetical protein [Nitrospiraceae bacterium]
MTEKNKKILALALSLFLTALVACKKQENQPVPVAATAQQFSDAKNSDQLKPANTEPIQKNELKIVVPADVKGKWKAVKIIVENKSTKKTQEYEINLNSDFTVPDSNLKIIVGEFLPHFMMDVDAITSTSNKLINPAVAVRIFDGKNQIFPTSEKQWGWLWGRKELQSIHPFDHPVYNFSLKEAVIK